MMRKYSLIFLFISLLLLMSLPKKLSEQARAVSVAFFAPLWEGLNSLSRQQQDSANEEIQFLQLENYRLSYEIEQLRHLYKKQHLLNFQLAHQTNAEGVDPILKSLVEAIPARVIFRSPASWNSTLWIDVGEKENEGLKKRCIAKNSPVVVAGALVGVIDYVGKHQSRVRLITDCGLTPSVRAVRGNLQQQLWLQEVIQLIDHLSEENFLQNEELQGLHKIKERLLQKGPTWYLAKGELCGNGQPLWRSRGQLLSGTGFNYDTADEYGPARDLRTGKPFEGNKKIAALSLIKPQDLLITTGMDGIFPAGLKVAQVAEVHQLKEGDYFYEIEAKPVIKNLEDLSFVFVMPPLGYDPEDLAPVIGH